MKDVLPATYDQICVSLLSVVSYSVEFSPVKIFHSSTSLECAGKKSVTGPSGALLFDRDQRSH